MHWGPGPSLGLLAVLGYVVFVFGSGLLWRNRGEIPAWVREEVNELRRGISRRDVPTRWSGLREEYSPAICLKPPPQRLNFHRSELFRAACLVFLGQILFLLDLVI
jgi:hypothetical protein